MNVTNEQRDRAFEKATEDQQRLYASPESGKQMRDIATKHNLVKAEQYKNYALLIGDVILNLRNRSELPTLLSKSLAISIEQAVKITGDIIDFLDQPSAITKETPPVVDISADIAETEAALRAAPNIRTMAGDMTQAQNPNEKVYSSTQTAILNEAKAKQAVKIPTPTHTPVPAPLPATPAPPIPKPTSIPTPPPIPKPTNNP